MTIFERVKETSKKQGYSSLKTLAEAAGLSQNVIYGWKSNQPSATALSAVAEKLNVSVDYLLGNTDEKNPHPAKDEQKEVDLEDDSIILKFDGQEISDEYRDFIIDQIRQIRKMRGN
ncbi:XRE family transcriptional regulator [Weissella muntiaci]|uniref:XRE family transcriptional regulator n=1 Tax=Weissella muntiaci TaxID=2508881 RepID=A0A6C2CA48_9LACO|nr:helix-turn-helix transcriptional regulator [Weissella muntiaci]TYC50854.1 XRE family transcriptional regulator [Weissella muntiaci]